MQRKTHSQFFFLPPALSHTPPGLRAHLSSHSFCTEQSVSSLSPTFQSCEERGTDITPLTTAKTQLY